MYSRALVCVSTICRPICAYRAYMLSINWISKKFTVVSTICQHTEFVITLNGANKTMTQKLEQISSLFCWLRVKKYYEWSVAFCSITFIRSLKKLFLLPKQPLVTHTHTQGHKNHIHNFVSLKWWRWDETNGVLNLNSFK